MNQSGWLTFSKLDFLARARFGKLDYKTPRPYRSRWPNPRGGIFNEDTREISRDAAADEHVVRIRYRQNL
jgi:hypothetical protein